MLNVLKKPCLHVVLNSNIKKNLLIVLYLYGVILAHKFYRATGLFNKKEKIY